MNAPLLLCYTPPLHRILREPWVNKPSGEDESYSPNEAWWCMAFCFGRDLPSRFHRHGLVPIVQAVTATANDYKNGVEDLLTTTVVFHDKRSYKAASSIVRSIVNGRTVSRFLVSEVDYIDVPFHHIHLFPEVIAA